MLLPQTLADKRCRSHSGISLPAVNKSSIPTFGERSLSLDIGLRRVLLGYFWLPIYEYPSAVQIF